MEKKKKVCAGSSPDTFIYYQDIWSFLQAVQQSIVWERCTAWHCIFKMPAWGSWKIYYRYLVFIWNFTAIIILNTMN